MGPWPRRGPVCVAWAACLLVACGAPKTVLGGDWPSAQGLVGAGRHALQASPADFDGSSNSTTLEEVVAGLQDGQTLRLTAPRVQLRGTLEIGAAGVRLEGAGPRSRTEIVCAPSVPGIIIRGNTTLVDLVISGSINASAVVIPDSQAVTSVEIRRVAFENNVGVDPTSTELDTEGGAIFAGLNSSLLIVNSAFTNNRALSGGAVFSAADLEVRRCQFNQCAANFGGGAINMRPGQPASNHTLIIQDCQFSQNSVFIGQADLPLVVAGGQVAERFQSFVFASPSGGGGALFFRDLTTVEITGSTFSENTAPAGGAVFAFWNPLSDLTGQYTVQGSNFTDNRASASDGQQSCADSDCPINHGGAMFLSAVTGTPARMRTCSFGNLSFTGNVAKFGGAMHLLTDGEVEIEDSIFENNTATIAGGGLLARTTGQFTWERSTAKGNAAQLGGGVYGVNGAKMNIEDRTDSTVSLFEANIASDGGALMCFGCQDVKIGGAQFFTNTAVHRGGGVHFVDSPPGATVELIHCVIADNVAMHGGGVSVDSVARFDMRNDSVRFNRAVSGGGLHVLQQSLQGNVVQITATNISDNEVLARSDLQDQLDSRNTRAVEQTLGFVDFDADSSDNLVGFVSECGNGGGGGICFALNQLSERSVAQIVISETSIRANHAENGGGLFVSLSGQQWGLTDCGLKPELAAFPCRHFRMVKAIIEGNSAEFGGGGMYITQPEAVFAQCNPLIVPGIGDPTNMTIFDAVQTVMANPEVDFLNATINQNLTGCLGFGGNRVSNDGFGPVCATTAVALEVTNPLGPITNHTSKENLAERDGGISVAVFDAFKQQITGGVPDAERVVEAQGASLDEGTSVIGKTIVKAVQGIANFDELIGFDVSGEHELTFRSGNLNPAETSFVIRNCSVGEEREEGGKGCKICPPQFYTFSPQIFCRQCPPRASCAGGAALVPQDGYWHSTPYSPVFHECIVREACSFVGRNDSLGDFYANLSALRPSDEAVENGSYRQCSKGYKGILCGSCEEGYGHFGGGECEECTMGRSGTTALILLFAAWSLLLVSFEVINSIMTNREMLLSDKSRKAKQVDARRGSEEGLPIGHIEGGHSLGMQTPDPLAAQSSSLLVALNPDHKGNNIFLNAVDVNDKLLQCVEIEDRYLPEHILAAEDLTETVKIMTNFLQVTAVAVSINVAWSRVVEFVLTIQELVAGVSNSAKLIPLDCSLDDAAETPKSIRALWLRAVFPLLMLVMYWLLVILFWSSHQAKRKRVGKGMNTTSLVDYLTIVTITVVFFAYNGVTEELMRAVNCIDVDSKSVKNSREPFAEFVNATDSYWAEDTDLVCFQGRHLPTAVVGIVGLLVFTFGFILFIVRWLYVHQDELDRERNITRYGFIYRAYRKGKKSVRYDEKGGEGGRKNGREWLNVDEAVMRRLHQVTVYWEAVITSRKAMIGAAVVFAYKLGGNLQGILALGVLILALAVQLLFKPFRKFPCFNTRRGLRTKRPTLHDRLDLNHLESFSIFVSTVTFYSGIVFHDENTTEGGEAAMAAFVVAVNATLLLYFVWRIYEETHVVLDLKLMDYDAKPSRALLVKCWGLLQAVRGRKDSLRQRNRRKSTDRVAKTEVRQAPDGAGSSNVAGLENYGWAPSPSQQSPDQSSGGSHQKEKKRVLMLEGSFQGRQQN